MNPFALFEAPILHTFSGLETGDLGFGAPPKAAMGDVSVRLFEAARKLGMPPPKLAAEIARQVDFAGAVTEAKPAGPYLNLRVDRRAFAHMVVGEVLAREAAYGANGLGAGKKALIEHTSINPNASPHVGRARNAMIGDSLARLLRFEGHDLTVHYYVNDIGRQIGLLVLVAADVDTLTFDEILQAYVDANKRAEEDEEFAAAGYELLVKMEEGDPETRERFRKVVDLCLGGQLAVLRRLGVDYDRFDRESAFLQDPRLNPVQAALEQRGALFTDEYGRIVVDLQQLGHERDEGRYFVLMRANGSSMYGYRDLAYNIEKEQQGSALNLVVLGEDHRLYQQQVSMILEAAGHTPPEAVYYAYILLKEGKMSTRQGKVVLLAEFLDEASKLSRERVAEQCTDLTEEEQHIIAEQVAVAAIRFSVLRVSPNKNVTFDMAENLSFTGDTGPYIQYSCARINSILRKYNGDPAAPPAKDCPLDTDAEWALVLKLSDFPEVVAGALRQRTVAPIAQYALETARLFTTFYHDCPVLTADTPERAQARAQLCAATRQTIANALHILGIEVPERM
ncbi:MAG: arginine--tRNA ligase [Candidatus Hydrogenedentota bacterium]